EDGDPIGTLHLWNEHLPRYNPGAGPDLAWAADIRRRLVESLQSLAQHAGTDPFWHDIKAFRGEAAFSSRLGTLQLNRVARRHGFECIVRGFSSGRPLRDLGNVCTPMVRHVPSILGRPLGSGFFAVTASCGFRNIRC